MIKYLIALFLVASTCFAADYHVATTGSDSNGCTNATTDACLTPAFGASKLTAAGDTLYIHAGTYNVTGGSAYYAATIYPRASGTAESRITIRNWPGDTVVLNGGSSPTNGIIGLGGTSTWYSYITIKGLTIIGQVKLMYGDYALLEDCDISEGGDSYTGDTGFGDVIFVAGGTGTTIRNNKIHDNNIGGGGIGNSPLIIEYDSTNLTIENNDIYNSVGAGIHLKDNPETVNVRYNYFYSNGYSGVNVGVQDMGHNVNIYQNIFRDNSLVDGGLFKGQVHLHYFVDGVNVYNNTFINGNYWGDISHQGGGTDGVINVSVYNNISYNPDVRHYDIGSDGGNARITDWTYSDYNCFYNDVSWKNGASSYSTIADWRTASSFDSNSVTSSPGFINASGTGLLASDYKRSSYTANGRGGSYPSVMGAYITGSETIGYSSSPPPTAGGGRIFGGGSFSSGGYIR
jgi:parallel beta-helix repeat protein